MGKPIPGALKRSRSLVLGAGVLTAATWIFFDVMKPPVPLGAAATTVVAGFWLGVIILIRYIWTRLRKRRVAGPQQSHLDKRPTQT